MFGLEADGTEKKNGRVRQGREAGTLPEGGQGRARHRGKTDVEEKPFEKPRRGPSTEAGARGTPRGEAPRRSRPRGKSPGRSATEQRREAPATAAGARGTPPSRREEPARPWRRPLREARGKGPADAGRGTASERSRWRARSKAKKLSAAQEKYRGMINELSSTSKAKIMDAAGRRSARKYR